MRAEWCRSTANLQMGVCLEATLMTLSSPLNESRRALTASVGGAPMKGGIIPQASWENTLVNVMVL